MVKKHIYQSYTVPPAQIPMDWDYGVTKPKLRKFKVRFTDDNLNYVETAPTVFLDWEFEIPRPKRKRFKRRFDLIELRKTTEQFLDWDYQIVRPKPRRFKVRFTDDNLNYVETAPTVFLDWDYQIVRPKPRRFKIKFTNDEGLTSKLWPVPPVLIMMPWDLPTIKPKARKLRWRYIMKTRGEYSLEPVNEPPEFYPYITYRTKYPPPRRGQLS